MESLTADNAQDDSDIFKYATEATFRFNPVLWKKQGGKGNVNLKVMAITTDGETIPEVEREVSINLATPKYAALTAALSTDTMNK